MVNKKYYYMRIKENFFDSNEIIILESMPDGYLYVNILLKLYLKSLKGNGKLMFNERIPYNVQMIATITRHQVGTVEKALKIFQEMGMIEIMESGAIYMMDIQQFIGKTSTEADRIRNYRRTVESEKMLGVQMYNKSTPEIEIEKEIELKKKIDKELELEKEFKKPTLQQIEQFINDNYLNVNAETFFNYYESNGWKVGDNKMKDWKATIKRWSANESKRKLPEYHLNQEPEETKEELINKLREKFRGEENEG